MDKQLKKDILIKISSDVRPKYCNYIGTFAKIKRFPKHPATWYRVELFDGKYISLRNPEFIYCENSSRSKIHTKSHQSIQKKLRKHTYKSNYKLINQKENQRIKFNKNLRIIEPMNSKDLKVASILNDLQQLKWNQITYVGYI